RPLPRSVGPYRILRLLGEGGMGTVYEAEQEHPRRTVALKVIRPGWATAEVLRRFEQESQALGRLQHPGIAQIHEAATADSGSGPQPYFAMEFIRGDSLHAYAATHHLNARQRLELMVKICDAVHHAHQRGIIHRDLKPGNILVDATGQPKILDFGVARVTDSDAYATRQTDVGQLIGTLAYMSPEQVLADPLELDVRSDVYALGVILYELLAGHLPYTISRQIPEAARAIREEDPAPLSSINRIYRGDIETIVAKSLEKEKARRYASAAELAGDLGRYLKDEPITARPPSTIYQLQKFARRHQALVWGIAAVFIVLIAGIIASTWQAARATRAEQAARAEAATATAINDFLLNDLLSQAGASTQAGPNTKPDPDLKVRTALDRAATRVEGKFDTQPVVKASIHSTIANAYWELGLFTEAEQHYRRAVDLRERALGKEHPDTLAANNNLGQLYREEGKYAEAEPILASVMAVRQRVLGADHPDTLVTMANLGIVLHEQGKYAEAEPLLTKVLETERRTRGEEDQETIISMMNLGKLYSDVGKQAEAEALLSRAVTVGRRTLGEEHPRWIGAMNNLAAIYAAQGKFTEAEPIFRTLSEVQRRILGDEHPDALTVTNNLAVVCRQIGKQAEAEALLTKVMEVQHRVLGDDHPNQLATMSSLAQVYQLQGKVAEAKALLTRSLAGQRRVNGPEHLGTLNTMRLLGGIYRDEGHYGQAEALLREALKGYLKVRPDFWARFDVESTLGASLAGQRRYAEAEPLLLSGYEGMSRLEASIPPVNKPSLQRAGEWIDALYQSSGRPAKAAEWRLQLQKP
ncbi:MAG TPA: serine/threonine-protein kinase, partial [Vicinamibacterales bacterium]|nr:serine/threonine-protein kinase [Vicinamibacterales bacterium]